MRELTEFDLRVLRHLNDWKSAGDLAWELGVSVKKVEESLERLLEAKKVWHDGSLYINRYGRRYDEGW